MGRMSMLAMTLTTQHLSWPLAKVDHMKMIEMLYEQALKTTVWFHLEFENAAELLIQRGAAVDAVGEFGDTALIWATNNGENKLAHI